MSRDTQTVARHMLSFHKRATLGKAASLKFFSMDPDEGRKVFLELRDGDGWSIRKAEEKDMLGPSFWIVRVNNAKFTPDLMAVTVAVAIGDRELKGAKLSSGFGRHGTHRITGEIIT